MKISFGRTLVAAGILGLPGQLTAVEAPTPTTSMAAEASGAAAPTPAVAASTGDPKAQLQALVMKINDKYKAGARTTKDYAGELAQFDALRAEHPGDRSNGVARILYVEAAFYFEVLHDAGKATELFKELQAQYPDFPENAQLPDLIPALEKMAAAEAIGRKLVAGLPFPNFEVKDIEGKPLSVAQYKGKVVLVDFWGMWCPDCVVEIPDLVATYQKYHDRGFEIIGVSTDRENAGPTLRNFIKRMNMPWPEFFDGKYRDNELAVKYGVVSYPTNYLLDRNGMIIAKGIPGPELAKAVGEALATPAKPDAR